MKPTECLSEGDRRACSNTGHSQDGGWLPSLPPPPQYVSSQTCPPGMGQLLMMRRREVQGLEGLRDGGGGLGVSGGGGVGGVCINPSQADS